MGEQAIHDIKMQFSTFILHPYLEIFEPGKPDAEFKNAARRFSWLKRALKEYDEKYSRIFPDQWYIEQMIAKEFCRQTKLHLNEILSTSHFQIDVSDLIRVLQSIKDFEKEI